MNPLVIVGVVVVLVIILAVAGFLLMGKEEELPVEVIAETTLPPVEAQILARYIHIEKIEPSPGMDPVSANNINLMEVIATDAAGASVLIGATVSGSSAALGGFPYTNLIDGNEATLAHNNPTATSTNEGVYIMLAQDSMVKKIEVVNRPGYHPRAVGLRITVLDSLKRPIFTSDIIRTPQARYSFNI